MKHIVQWYREPYTGLPWWMTIPMVLSFALRVGWQLFPDPLVCAIFWTVSFVDEPFKWRYLTWWARVGSLPLYVGGAANSLVTLANRGKMPVEGIDSAFSLWTPTTDATHLAWLGDNYAGFSLGDMFIGVYLGCAILIRLATPITKALVRSKPQ